MSLPTIIQGGMGVAVSNWRLARSVAQLGQLGVVSGALLAVVFARRLQAGDAGGQMRYALSHFPIRHVAERVIEAYYIPNGKDAAAAFASNPMPTVKPGASFVELTVTANFAEVFLAKEGHSGPVGINLLEKIQLSTLPSLYGAMLGGVDYVLMGAGIPRHVPGALDRFAAGEAVDMRIDVEGALTGEEYATRFDPVAFCGEDLKPLTRPKFLPIVSSSTLAVSLARKSNGRVDGFIIEGDVAGGHNAPPRGPLQISAEGEPVYGPRDVPDLAAFRALGLPFWLAGAKATPEKYQDALSQGAIGIQVGTAFAFCNESGIKPEIQSEIIRMARMGQARVFTDPLASPTGFPFKVIQMEGTLSKSEVYEGRERVCDLGYLRQTYRREDGSLGYRCAAEPVADYVRKGGDEAATKGRKCLCNGLAAAVGWGQVRPQGHDEDAILTAGNDISNLARYLSDTADNYSAADVVGYLLSKSAQAELTQEVARYA
ncbi:MAG: nitronate monooxygenase [Opitutaceae bacterium]|jgi:NAD(P)H-dependent flavin oxidoreductase YrpB (nitropropane dioxygenase family)